MNEYKNDTEVTGCSRFLFSETITFGISEKIPTKVSCYTI